MTNPVAEAASGLEPCPFCKSAFKLGQEPHDTPRVGGQFYLYHDYGPLGSDARKCRLEITGYFETREDAVSFWNRRATPPVAKAVAAEPDGYLDRLGNVSVVDGSRLIEELKALPDAPVGQPVLPIYAPSTVAHLQQEIQRLTEERERTAHEGPELRFAYKNYRGEHGYRRVSPLRMWFGSTDWHPEPQWLLRAFDLDKGEERDFAISDINSPDHTFSRRGEDGCSYDQGRRDVLNAILTPNPAIAAKIARWAEPKRDPDPEGRLPFDVVLWVTEVAAQLGIEPKDELASPDAGRAEG